MFDHWRRYAGVVPARALVLAVAVIAGAAGCASHSPASPGQGGAAALTAGQPAWSHSLGSGVVITAPAVTAAGHGSPGAALRGEVDAIDTGKLAATCPYFPPASQSGCRSAFTGSSASAGVSVSHFALGYVATRGDEALVGSTGKYCAAAQTPECTSNTNPAAIFAAGKSFARLWAEAISLDSSGATNTYSLAPCVRIGGRWYIYNPPGGP
jgi:hypothetical protein